MFICNVLRIKQTRRVLKLLSDTRSFPATGTCLKEHPVFPECCDGSLALSVLIRFMHNFQHGTCVQSHWLKRLAKELVLCAFLLKRHDCFGESPEQRQHEKKTVWCTCSIQLPLVYLVLYFSIHYR